MEAPRPRSRGNRFRPSRTRRREIACRMDGNPAPDIGRPRLSRRFALRATRADNRKSDHRRLVQIAAQRVVPTGVLSPLE